MIAFNVDRKITPPSKKNNLKHSTFCVVPILSEHSKEQKIANRSPFSPQWWCALFPIDAPLRGHKIIFRLHFWEKFWALADNSVNSYLLSND